MMRVSLYRIFLIITDLIKFIIVTNFFNAYLFKSKKTHRFGPVHDTAANLTISFFLFSRYIDILSKPYYTSNNITANALRLDTRTGISQFFFIEESTLAKCLCRATILFARTLEARAESSFGPFNHKGLHSVNTSMGRTREIVADDSH